MTYDQIRNKTIFSIEKQGDEKVIHFYGYGYTTDDKEKPYRLLEYTFCYVPLSEVIDKGFYTCEDEYGSEAKQYITDLETEEEVVKCYEHYDDGKAPQLIDLTTLSMDTPCGAYIGVYGAD